MEKIDVLMVVLNREFLERALSNLNFDKVNLARIIMDSDEETFPVGEEKIPVRSFANVPKLVKKYKGFTWLIVGYKKSLSEVFKMKKFLSSFGISERRIVNFELGEQINPAWLANLRHIEERGADFFATGDEYTQNGLDFKFIPRIHVDKAIAKGGVNLADAYQDLRQSYLTAKHVFEHVAPNTIKFVLIGLSPDSFCYDNAKDFPHCAKNLQYVAALNAEPNINDNLLKKFVSDNLESVLAATDEQADLNFDAIKISYKNKFSLKAVVDLGKDKKILSEDAVESNVQILKAYIELCLANGAKPVGIIFPFAPIVRKTYDAELLKSFRETIQQLENDYNFMCVDWFNHLNYDCFCDTMHLNSNGILLVNAVISMKLNAWKLIPDENFCDRNYSYFHKLSFTAPKDEYNALMNRIFSASAQAIRRKDKIKVGFVLIEASQWCGDDLHKFFADDKRFETTIFLSKYFNKPENEVFKKDFFLHGIEQLKSHNLNVIPMDKKEATIPAQDVLIFLTPYIPWLGNAFQLKNLKPTTLITHIFYAFDSSIHLKKFYNDYMFHVAWKMFFSTVIDFKLFDRESIIGMPRGLYSGYPRMDIFFKPDTKFHFEWKTTRPDAKKIIWAPHHSIRGTKSVRYATFHWNYKFMYEFAKAHPEISWVVKPHPWLPFSVVKENIFPTEAAFKEYLQAWNDLPNAQVYTGAYYQQVFATSDGMIHDCGSFMAEYQYMNKPMIYLTRDTQKYNDLGKKILSVSYLVDGKDLKGIAATIQKVFIEGNDAKAAIRKELFDKYLNYPKTNGMLASEYIYRSIADDFKSE